MMEVGLGSRHGMDVAAVPYIGINLVYGATNMLAVNAVTSLLQARLPLNGGVAVLSLHSTCIKGFGLASKVLVTGILAENELAGRQDYAVMFLEFSAAVTASFILLQVLCLGHLCWVPGEWKMLSTNDGDDHPRAAGASVELTSVGRKPVSYGTMDTTNNVDDHVTMVPMKMDSTGEGSDDRSADV
eukprot:TRINITY_DN60658_c0_g1_i1.p1 TRINITY_DN60658_c0_g1~~TRINITY_DN60658_c0_g1_i1.p1  ORF type:complete len:186 (-),score=33.58 TRINITY_DN60658_c0_g1_i1:318-875(-)